MKKIKTLLLLFLFLSAPAMCKVDSICIDSCMLWARQNYPIIEQLNIIEQLKDYNLKNFNSQYVPKLNILGTALYHNQSALPYNSSENISEFRLATAIHLEQTIWDGGQTNSNKKIAKATAEVEKMGVEVKLFELRSKICEIYFSILLSQEQKNKLDRQLNYMNTLLSQVSSAVKNGTAYSSDILAVEAKSLQIYQEKIKLETAENIYRQILSIFIAKNLDDNTFFEYPNVEILPVSQEVVRPELELLEKRKELLEAHNPGLGSLLPTVSLQGFGALGTPKIDIASVNSNYILLGGIAVKWPIGSNIYNSSRDKKRLKLEKDIIESEKESFELSRNIGTSRQMELKSQWDSIIMYDEKIIEILCKRKSAIEQRYTKGIADIKEYIDCICEEDIAQSEKILHTIERSMAIYQYNLEIGY